MSILDDKLEMLATSRPQLRSYELARTKLSAFVKEYVLKRCEILGTEFI